MKSDQIGSSIDKITVEAVENSATSIIPAGSILVVVRSGILARAIPTALTTRDLTVNQDIKALCPTKRVHNRYLHYFMQSAEGEILKLVTRGATVHRLSTDRLKAFPIPVPPLPEQKRIVAILDEAFEGIGAAVANAEKSLANARELFESYLQAVFTKRGAGWVDRPLGSMCERITKGSSPKWQGVSYVEKPGILFVTSENVGEYQVLIEKPKYVEEKFNIKDKKSILKKGDVLTNIVGASIGRTAVFDRDDLANINQAVCLIRCEPNLLNNCFLTYLLNSLVFKQVLHDNEVDNARANLSLGFGAVAEVVGI